jgi:heat shock protein HtpX
MISALRKIEGRGELTRANSAVMEMCIDNPREGFADVFATHPSVDKRIEALIKFAGGHDPGPLALPGPNDDPNGEPAQIDPPQGGPTGGPWGSGPPDSIPDSRKPFLPSEPPINQGPWGPKP